eukprot:Skav223361  [mRNA]  locus=scaffold200:559357:562679:+ [translate_table: standard]
MLPGSLTACIGTSSWLWQIEGSTAVLEVARLTELMCRSAAGTESLNALLVTQHTPSTRSAPSKSPAGKRPPLLRQMSSLKSGDIADSMIKASSMLIPSES